ncbi:hypothetical protein G7Y89_g14238 [Cudoniella acicularis]|uniref:Uncharacterized protein n=1 Tax=Cudoniella acicularis TaxID=354080 RepID=A0A8H4R5I7_9HELO|nr:hypothetical protein G7Y89_g14238 [Cudoniella acicularis]
MNEELALTVSKQLTERSHGNFLSVKLQFAELSRQTTTYELKESLKKLPTELADTYGLLLSSIADQPSKKADLAMRTLQWLAYSRRPLTLSELQQAVSIDPRDPSAATDPERLPPPLLILEVCKDLIEIRIEQNKVLAKHASLAHYLRNFRETLFPDGKKYIAESITSFFQNSHLSGGSLDIQEQYDARENLLPFSVYASQYWGFHLANHLAEYPAPAADAIRNILENESLLKTISQILHVSKNHEKGDCRVYPSNFGPLHFAVYFGLTAAVVDIVDKLTGFESMVDSWGRDAVHIACQQVEADRSSHCRRAQEESTSSSLREVLLIDRSHGDENLKAQSEDFLKIVNYLSNRGFLLDRRDHYGRVPLHWAVLQGSTRVVSVLGQQCRSSVRITDKWGRDPLYYAAERGNIELVSSLLGLGAAREGHALSIAASNGHRRTVEKLLAYGYDSNDDEALFEAARNGFTDIVSRLYRQGANQSWEDENGMAALHHAAHAGHAEITKYLVMEGADINKPDWTGRSPLLLASENGDLATIQLLIKRGAVVDTTDHSGNAALDKAAENGHPEVVRYLLRHGARTNSDGSRQSYRSPNPSAQRRLTPLQIAGKSGFDSVAQVLLEESSSPDKAGCTNRTPLSYAAEAGHESIVKLLLSTHRVDVNAEDELARTPLSYASEGGYVDIMKLLLGERGVDINTRDEKGRTPLSYAAEMGHVTAALLLLVQPGMIAMIADDSGLTPRDYARENGHSQVVMALDDKASIAKNGLPGIFLYKGYFTLQAIQSKVVYCLKFSQGFSLHSRDWEPKGVNTSDFADPQSASPITDSNNEWVIRRITGQKVVDGVRHYRVQWEDTWMPEYELPRAKELVDASMAHNGSGTGDLKRPLKRGRRLFWYMKGTLRKVRGITGQLMFNLCLCVSAAAEGSVTRNTMFERNARGLATVSAKSSQTFLTTNFHPKVGDDPLSLSENGGYAQDINASNLTCFGDVKRRGVVPPQEILSSLVANRSQLLGPNGSAQLPEAKTVFTTLVSNATPYNILCFLIAYFLLDTTVRITHRLYFSPLAPIPGPKLAAATRLYEFYYQGLQHTKFPYQVKKLHAQYGPIVRISPFEISLNDSEFNIDFFMSDKKLDKDPWYYFFGFTNAIFVLLNKDKHKMRQTNLSNHFRGKYWSDAQPMITTEISSLVSKFEISSLESTPLNVSKAYRKTGNELLRNFLLGEDYNGQNSDSRDFAKEASTSFQPLFRAAAWTRHFPWMFYMQYLTPTFVFEKVMPMAVYKREIEAMVPSIIKNHDELGTSATTSVKKALIYEMIDHDPSYREKGAKPLIEEFMELLWGGRESIGHALTSVTYQILTQPHCQAKLYQELKNAPFDINTATYGQLKELKYLWAVCKEGIRMQFGCRFRIPRVSSSPVHYKQYVIPAGTAVSMSPSFFHDDADIFPDPLTFKPERWLEASPEELERLEKFWNPFGNGSRSCGGRPMAYEVIFRATANVFSRYKLDFDDGCNEDYCYGEGMMEVFPQENSTGLRTHTAVPLYFSEMALTLSKRIADLRQLQTPISRVMIPAYLTSTSIQNTVNPYRSHSLNRLGHT